MDSAALFGLGAALSYGAGDAASGALSRRLPPLLLLALGQGAALLVLLPVAVATTLAGVADTPGTATLGWGGLAGAAGAVGGYCFVRGFRGGRLAVVAPAASVTAAGLPVLADLATGARPGPVVLAGIALAVVAVALVGAGEPRSARSGPSGLGWGLGAGTAHAVMYLLLDRAGAGPWPVTAAFVVTAGLAAAALVLASRVRPRVARRDGLALLAVGVCAAAGTVGFSYAAVGGLGVAAVTTELSPVVTALLARLVLGEPVPPRRALGLALAVVATTLIGVG